MLTTTRNTCQCFFRAEASKEQASATLSPFVRVQSYSVHHIFREDIVTDGQRKSVMQLCLVLGMTLGYPLTEIVDQSKIVFWSLAGVILLTAMLTLLAMNGRKLSKHTADSSFKISLITILFKKVGRHSLRGRSVACWFYWHPTWYLRSSIATSRLS